MDALIKRSLARTQQSQSDGKRIVKKSVGAMTDEELREALAHASAQIRVVGCGGSGNNTMLRMNEIGIHGAELIALNTDAQHLLITKAQKKVLIGKEITRGLGAGANPEVGEAAAKESVEDIASVLQDADMVFITCGLGGGTGTGSAPVVAEVARDLGALTLGIVTLPFSVEGRKRMENAMNGLQKLRKTADTVIVIPNDKLLEIVPELPLNAAFKVADEVLSNAVKGITELITKPGLVNLDFADVRTILTNGGAAMIGLGQSTSNISGESRALEAIEEALNSPLLDVDVSDAQKALVNVIGGADMTLREAEVICEAVASKIHQNSHIIWGAMIDEEMPRNSIQAMVLIAGGRVPYLDQQAGEELELDIDYVERRKK
ncbi:cell division protein FtsZ [Candidatus Micrarchaeota archaeon]|nr:cell division protein FtsZ [Candidatus Micrarchaeota archaeon]